jgi:hypothetical protein
MVTRIRQLQTMAGPAEYWQAGKERDCDDAEALRLAAAGIAEILVTVNETPAEQPADDEKPARPAKGSRVRKGAAETASNEPAETR